MHGSAENFKKTLSRQRHFGNDYFRNMGVGRIRLLIAHIKNLRRHSTLAETDQDVQEIMQDTTEDDTPDLECSTLAETDQAMQEIMEHMGVASEGQDHANEMTVAAIRTSNPNCGTVHVADDSKDRDCADLKRLVFKFAAVGAVSSESIVRANLIGNPVPTTGEIGCQSRQTNTNGIGFKRSMGAGDTEAVKESLPMLRECLGARSVDSRVSLQSFGPGGNMNPHNDRVGMRLIEVQSEEESKLVFTLRDQKVTSCCVYPIVMRIVINEITGVHGVPSWALLCLHV